MHGLHDGSTEPGQIEVWWQTWPNANLGFCTGVKAGIFVLGPDGQAGLAALGELEAKHGPLPLTPIARTGSGGKHYYFRLPPGVQIKNRANHRKLPIDIRGEGGLAVAPPSRNANGPYVWEVSPDECAPAMPPTWLVEWCAGNGRPNKAAARAFPAQRPASGGEPIIARAVAYLNKIPPAISGQGGHGQTLFAARAMVWGFDLGPERGFQLLWDQYNPRCQPAWSEEELRHKCSEADTVEFDKQRGWLLHERNGHASTDHLGNAAPVEAEIRPNDGRPAVISNYMLQPSAGEGDKLIKVGLAPAHISQELLRLTGGWPKRQDNRLFVPEDNRPFWLDGTEELFAWIARQLPMTDWNRILWAKGEDKVSRQEFAAYLCQTVERYDAVESMPHEPPLPGCYYLHPPSQGGTDERWPSCSIDSSPRPRLTAA